MKLPKSWSTWRTLKALPQLIEAGFKMEQQRKELEAQAEAIKKERLALEDHIIEKFTKEDLREVKTSLGSAKLAVKVLPTVDKETGGWDAIWKYIFKHKAYDLVEKRLGQMACKARWDAGETIPGVTTFTKLSIKFGEAEKE